MHLNGGIRNPATESCLCEENDATVSELALGSLLKLDLVQFIIQGADGRLGLALSVTQTPASLKHYRFLAHRLHFSRGPGLCSRPRVQPFTKIIVQVSF